MSGPGGPPSRIGTRGRRKGAGDPSRPAGPRASRSAAAKPRLAPTPATRPAIKSAAAKAAASKPAVRKPDPAKPGAPRPAAASPHPDAPPAAAAKRSGTAAPARSMKARAAAAKAAKRAAASARSAPPRPGAPARKSGAAPAAKSADSVQGGRSLSVVLRTARGRTTTQQHWLQRQLNDPYVAAAQAQGWRSRAAFKLIELDERFHLIRPGMRVLDLGAAPGGWCQVAIKRGAGQVIGLDLLEIDTVPGATLLVGDFTEPGTPGRLQAALGGRADLVLSDMAPNTTGHTATDHIRIVDLASQALDFARQVLAPGGAFVAKVLQGGSEKAMMDSMRRDFALVRHAKPPASRRESSELYVVATGFRAER